MKLISTNPSKNYEVIGEVEVSTEKEVQAKVLRARKALSAWRDIGLDGRIELMRKLMEVFASRKEDMAQLMSSEMGMLLEEARDDMMYSNEFLEWYCDHAHEHLDPVQTYEDEVQVDYVYREPRGVVAAIAPWNFPMSNFVWTCGQNLICGNTVVFKHSEETPLFGKAIEECFAAVQFPPGVFEEVYGDGTVGDLLVKQDINMICFTGSTKTGQYLARVAGEKMIPLMAELGGSAPGIVFDDADVAKLADTIYIDKFLNCGQICDGLKRLIVHESKYDEVVSRLMELITSKKLGPLVAERQVKLLEAQVHDAVDKGATILVGGKRGEGGAYYEATLLSNITFDMRVWREEVFGPVLPIVTFTSEEEAVRMANDTMYGLGGYVFTQDKERFMRVARQLQTGMVGQNSTSYVKACNPFGGYKKSGLGREHGSFGFHDLTQVKAVSMEK